MRMTAVAHVTHALGPASVCPWLFAFPSSPRADFFGRIPEFGGGYFGFLGFPVFFPRGIGDCIFLRLHVFFFLDLQHVQHLVAVGAHVCVHPMDAHD